VDPWLHNVSRGRVTSVAMFPVVLLTTTGRKSGEQRTTPLLYFTDGDHVVVIASNYGQKHHPAWYLNLGANPEVTMSAGGVTARYVGREATGDERERIWNTATQYVDNYRQYEATTGGRRIPVLVFTPVEARERRFERGGAGDTTADSPA
jgi:deazaflavin-dependent oxidoreductase (nitroreductase family)